MCFETADKGRSLALETLCSEYFTVLISKIMSEIN